MSASPHLAELAKKHRLLEQKIQEELARPSVDSVRISSLKLEKLRLKDRIAQMDPAIRH